MSKGRFDRHRKGLISRPRIRPMYMSNVTNQKITKDWALEFCANLWCRCHKRGISCGIRKNVDKVGIRKCVAVVNNRMLGQAHGVRISTMCANRFKSQLLEIEVNAATHGGSDLSNFIYFQKIQGKHSLKMHVPTFDKDREACPPKDIPFIQSQLNLLPMRRGCYIMTNLHETPHGGASLVQKGGIDKCLFNHNIDTTTVVHGGKKGEVNMIKDWGLAVWYPNQIDVRNIPHATAGEDSLLSYALDKASKLVVDNNRNGGSKDGVNRRIRFGCGQSQRQRTSYTRYRCYDKKRGKSIAKQMRYLPGGV